MLPTGVPTYLTNVKAAARQISFLVAIGFLIPTSPVSAEDPETQNSTRERTAIRGCAPDEECREEARHTTFIDSPSDRKGPWLSPSPRHVAAPPASPSRPRWTRGLQLPDLPMRWDPTVLKFIDHFRSTRKGRSAMSGWLRSQGKYRKMIKDELRRASLPEDLLFVSMVESSYRPKELSYAGASGLWQFMPTGGEIYGLRQDYWLDERNDPSKATHAVTTYWLDLYERFGNWHLALAAFNGGHSAVLRSVVKYNTNDFWRLTAYENGLPFELKNYVSKILAVAFIAKNRKFFGFEESKVRDHPALVFDTVKMPGSVWLRSIASAGNITEAELVQLNPELKRNRTPPHIDGYDLKVPKGTKAAIANGLPSIKKRLQGVAVYKVKRGQGLRDVAKLFGTSSSSLAALNGTQKLREITAGTPLVVPRASPKKRGKKTTEDIIVVAPPNIGDGGKKRIFYRVARGDTLYGIAKSMRVSPHKLAFWNGLDSKTHLQPKMILAAWLPKGANLVEGLSLLDSSKLRIVTAGTPEHLDLAEERIGRKRIIYKAKRKESFETIGRQFGLTARDMARINRRPHTSVLERGETALVYKVVDPSKSDRARRQSEAARRR